MRCPVGQSLRVSRGTVARDSRDNWDTRGQLGHLGRLGQEQKRKKPRMGHRSFSQCLGVLKRDPHATDIRRMAANG
jgi:hypothetical protein